MYEHDRSSSKGIMTVHRNASFVFKHVETDSDLGTLATRGYDEYPRSLPKGSTAYIAVDSLLIAGMRLLALSLCLLVPYASG